MALDRRPLRRQPENTGVPLRRVLEVAAQEVVVHHLGGARPGVRERARRQDPVVDARVRVGDPLLRQRAAGAARPDRVAERAVVLDDALLGHHERLGLDDDVAVVAVVVERRRHDDVAAAERELPAVRERVRGQLQRQAEEVGRVVAGDARGVADLVVRIAARAVRDQQLVVELLLGREPRPLLRGVEQRRDLVLVAILVAGLDADDEGHRHAAVGGRGRDVVGRRLGVVGLQAVLARVGRLVDVGERRRLVALCVQRAFLALPWLRLRTREDGAAVGVVDDLEARAAAARDRRHNRVDADLEPLDKALDAPVRAPRERGRHVAPADEHLQLLLRDAGRQVDGDEGVAVGDQVRAVGQHLEAHTAGAERSARRNAKRDDRAQQSRTDPPPHHVRPGS